MAVASTKHPSVPCLSLSSLRYNAELTEGQHLLPCILSGLKEQEVVIRLFKKKTTKNQWYKAPGGIF